MFKGFSHSVKGASHEKTGLVCQDSSAFKVCDNYAIAVVADGHGSKPFELPQADPDYHRQFMKSYNIPEFMKAPVEVTPQQFASILRGTDGEPVKYVPKLTP